MKKYFVSLGAQCFVRRDIVFIAAFLFAVAGIAGCKSLKEKKGTESSRALQPGARKNAWETVGYGGGGAMFYPELSPHDPACAFVSCDMTGAYVTYNGGESWRMFNLHGPVHFYVFDPLEPNTVYANSIALFKSTDKGVSWNLLYPLPSETIGLVSKGDHAEEIVVTRDSTVREVQAFAVDPGNSKKLYAVISIDRAAALYYSFDGGLRWAKEKDLKDRAKNIYILPSSSKDNRTLYITGNTGITVRDNGKWKINDGPAGVKSLTHFTGGFDKSRNKFIFYAIAGKSYFDPAGNGSGIYYSEDGGASWQNRQDGLAAFNIKGSDLPEWRAIATCLNSPEVVYVSYNNMKANVDTSFIGVAKSEDFGKTWKLCWKDIIKKNGNVPSANFKGGWINERFGPTWGENPFSIGVSPGNPGICYATDFGRTVKTQDGGNTWEQVYTRKKQDAGWTSRGLEVTTGYMVISNPFDKRNVFICNTDIGLMESKDGGASWESATKNNGIPRNWQNSTYWLAFDPEIKGKAWAAMSDVHDLPRPKMFRKKGIKGYKGGVVVTEDGGKSWMPVSGDIGEAAITHLLIDPSGNKNARTLYACAFGKGVYKSVDGGKTWNQKNKGISGTEPFAWRITRSEKEGTLFLVITRRSDDGSIGNSGDGALYRSDDGAESWKPVALPAETNAPMSLMIDNEQDGRLLISAWGRATKGKLSPDKGGGIFLSGDDGKIWKAVLQKDQHIHDITYDPRNKTFYACGFGGSAYRSLDRGYTWSRIKGYNFKWGKRVDPDPLDPGKIYIITFGGGVWHGPSEGDENSLEDIVTPVLNN
ncbi:MAG: hypothetical protein ABI760_03330 [Ferruginibacter sp.]